MAAASVSKANTQISTESSHASDPRFLLIQKTCSDLPVNVVALCLDYLIRDFIFPTPREFIGHFQKHNELNLSAGQSLFIRDVSLISRNQGEAPYPSTNPIADLCRFLSGLVAPLARRISCYAVGVPLILRLPSSRNDCFVQGEKDIVFKAEKTPIEFRLSDLFRLMVICSIPQVTFTPDQEVVRIWGFSAQEAATMSNQGTQVLNSRCLPGMSFSHSLKTAEGSLKVVEALGGSFHALQSTNRRGPLTFSITSLHRHETIRSFLQYLDIFGEISLQPNQTLSVTDEMIPDFYKMYREYFAQLALVIPQYFMFNQLIIHTGNEFQWEGQIKGKKEEAVFQWDTASGMISVTPSENPLVLKQVRSPVLSTTLEVLGSMLIRGNRNHLSLKPGQELRLFGLSKEECDFSTRESRLRNLFPRQNPTGFVWSIDCRANFDWQEESIDQNSSENIASFLSLTPHAGSSFQLSLKRANGEELIANLLLNASPLFIQALHDMESSAIEFLLFRALMYYCCEDFRYYRVNEAPDFFSEGTVEQIKKLLKDQPFADAREQVLENPEWQDQLAITCLESSAEEFTNLDRTKLPKPLQLIFKKVSEISSSGVQRNPLFLSRDLVNYLKNNPLPTPKNESAAAKPDSKSQKE
ncbi:MAG TPA: hypothetical protein VGM34_01040 [Chlamydiales bacterium]|jgi:hypothetical protein